MRHQWIIRIAAVAGLVAAGVVFARWEPPEEPGQRVLNGGMNYPSLRTARGLLREGRYTEAIEILRPIAGRSTRGANAWYLLGDAYERRGDPGDAERSREAFERVERVMVARAERGPTPTKYHELGWVRRRLGLASSKDAFEHTLRLHLADSAGVETETDAVWMYNLACYRALVGDREGATTAFVRSVELGYTDLAHARRDNDLDLIRDEPRFIDAMETLEAVRAERMREAEAEFNRPR